METDTDSPHGRLALARLAAGYLTQADFARECGMKEVTYRSYESGQNGFAKHAADFARRLRVSVEWLLEGGPTPPKLKDSDRAFLPDQVPMRSADLGEIAEIVRLDLSLPMGPGALVDDYVEGEPITFDLAFIRAFTRSPPHRLRLADGVGDSMTPTLLTSDLVWIDTTQNQLLHSDRIYAATINGGAAIKRLRPIEGGKRILVISDNKTIDSYAVDANDVHIWGRIIRFERDL